MAGCLHSGLSGHIPPWSARGGHGRSRLRPLQQATGKGDQGRDPGSACLIGYTWLDTPPAADVAERTVATWNGPSRGGTAVEVDYLSAEGTKIYVGWSRHWVVVWLWFLS